MIILPESDEDLLRECDVETFRSSGPGGQLPIGLLMKSESFSCAASSDSISHLISSSRSQARVGSPFLWAKL